MKNHLCFNLKKILKISFCFCAIIFFGFGISGIDHQCQSHTNYGRNADLLRACKPLEEYSWFINRINEILFDQDPKDIVIATKTAIDEIPMDFEIRSFLISHKAEVTGMLDTEYNEAEIKELFVEEGLQKGIIGCIELLRSLGLDDVVIAEKIMQQYSLTKEEAAKYLN